MLIVIVPNKSIEYTTLAIQQLMSVFCPWQGAYWIYVNKQNGKLNNKVKRRKVYN